MRHVIFGSGINAFTIEKGLKSLGLTVEYGSWDEDREHNEEAVAFFTDEANLSRAMETRACRFEPEAFGFPVDDKLAFSRILASWGETVLAYAEMPPDDSEVSINPPFCIKARSSWIGSAKTPRGYVCRSREDMARAVRNIARLGWQPDGFFLQQYVEGPVENSFSVSGYFDARNPHRAATIVTRKLLGYHKEMTTGAVVQTLPDPADLVARTRAILTRADYTGPFEMEFLRDPQADRYYVLELNPRFWMQHGIFVDFHENAVIRRYVGADETGDWNPQAASAACLWISLEAVLVWMCKAEARQLSRFCGILKRSFRDGERLTVYPSPPKAVASLGRQILKRIGSPWRSGSRSIPGLPDLLHRRAGSR